MKGVRLSLALLASFLAPHFASGAILGPYSADASTLHLWHFDEAATPCIDYGTAATATNLTYIINGASLGNASYSGFTNCISFGATAGSGDVIFNAGSGNVGTPLSFTYAGTNGAFTFEAMVYVKFNPTASGSDPFQIMDCDSDSSTRVFQLRLDPIGFSANTNPSNVGIEFINGTGQVAVPPIPSGSIAQNNWYHVAVTYNGSPNTTSNLLFYWTPVSTNATNAICIYGANMSGNLPETDVATTVFSVGNSARNPSGGTGADAGNFVGFIDEVRISSVARASNQMLFGVVSTGIPIITSEPSPSAQSVASGQTVNYSVSATGPQLTYQWLQNGLLLSNATNSELTMAAVFPSNSGGYAVLVSNSYGAVTSTVVNLTVTGFATNGFKFDSFSDSFWAILNQGNGQAFVAEVVGATQQPYTNGAAAQEYQVLLNLQNGTFRLRQRSNWACVSSLSNPAGPGAELSTLNAYSGALNQQWYLVSAGGGYYRIFNASSNTVLQTDNGSPAKVTLQAASTSPYQLWQLSYQTNFPKKGTAGYEGSPYNTELTTQWAYNYDDNTGASEAASFDFVPMVYDAPDWENLGAAQGLDGGWLTSAKPAYLLCYNEPDNSTQSDTSTNAAIANWPALEALNVPLVGPATQDTEDAWENSFYQLIANNNYRVDYAAIHEYVPPNAASLISDCQSVYNAYGRPVWLTEFSPVDWSGCKCWSEDDDYNFLAEFLYQVESLTWFKRYAIFPFSNTNPDSPWVDNGFTGSVFLADGQTLSPYGELYATWDATLTVQAQTAYIIHNLGTSFRLTDTVGVNTPHASDLYVRNATTEWALLPAPETGHWYIISLNDGRRLRNNGGTLDLAPFGTTNAAVDWWFNGPSSLGYYYLDNLALSQSIQATGTAPAISCSMINDPAPSAATEWRLVKAYQPVAIPATVTPDGLSATAGDGTVVLGWMGSASDLYYNVYRSTIPGGPYTLLASLLTNTAFTDNTVSDGNTYYYVGTGLNILAQESAYSTPAMAQPVSLTPPTGLWATAGDGTVALGWVPSASEAAFNVYRSTTSGGPYTPVASLVTNATFTDTTVTDGVTYYYVVTGLNALSQQSGDSAATEAQPTSLTPPQLSFAMTGNGLLLNWPSANTGWLLQAQTNSLGTNWVTIAGSSLTNQIFIAINPANACVFYQLVYLYP